MTNTIDELMHQAHALAADYFAEERATRGDDSLSPSGKQTRIAGARKHYAMMLELLRDKARAYVDQDIGLAAAKIERARADVATERRALLGDAVYSDIIRASLEASETDEIITALGDAADDFTRAVIAGYGTSIVIKRIASEGPTVDSLGALDVLQGAMVGADVADIESDLDQLRRFDVAQLDVVGETQRRADVYGLDEEIVRELVTANAPALPDDYKSADKTAAGELYAEALEQSRKDAAQQAQYDAHRQVAHQHPGIPGDMPEIYQ